MPSAILPVRNSRTIRSELPPEPSLDVAENAAQQQDVSGQGTGEGGAWLASAWRTWTWQSPEVKEVKMPERSSGFALRWMSSRRLAIRA